jgi:copper chaperone
MIAFEVNDMSCAHCVSAITQALKGVDKHARVQIDLARHRVQVHPSTAHAQELADAIRQAGYTPLPVTGASTTAARPSGGCCGCR